MHIESIRGYPAKGVGEPGEQNGEDMSCIRELMNARSGCLARADSGIRDRVRTYYLR